jgi:hypothetical protein
MRQGRSSSSNSLAERYKGDTEALARARLCDDRSCCRVLNNAAYGLSEPLANIFKQLPRPEIGTPGT